MRRTRLCVRTPSKTGLTARCRFLAGLGLLAVFVALFVLAGRAIVDGSKPRNVEVADGRAISIGPSWPGALDGCVSDPHINVLPNCYREPVARGSFVKQSWSAWSALAFSAVGLPVLFEAGKSGSGRGSWLGAAAIAAGLGGLLFHSTLTSWAAWADTAMTYTLFSAVLVIGILSLLDRPFEGATRGRSGARLLLALGLLVAAVVMLVVSEPFVGDPIGLPLHAAWHVLAALFVLAYWRYLPPEAAHQSAEREAPSVALS